MINVLIACEYSGAVRDEFKKLGCFAISCDLLDTEVPGNHYRGDVTDILYEPWDIIIAHPPCTYITNSGVRWLYNKDGSKNEERWAKMEEAAKFFKLFVDHPCRFKRIENPIPHKHALSLIGVKYSQIIHPYQFGHMEQKSTCLWNFGLPDVVETNNVKDKMMKLPKKERQKIHYASPGKDRWKIRSRTFKGIAEAIAKQTIEYYESHTTSYHCDPHYLHLPKAVSEDQKAK